MRHLGTFTPGSTVYAFFNTRTIAGVPVALASGTVRVLKDGNTTEDDSGITLTADFDSRVGLAHVAVDTSSDSAFYTDGEFVIHLTVGTANSVSLVGGVVAHFTLDTAAAGSLTTVLRPALQSTMNRGF